MRGYDVLAFSTKRESMARISVKSRWSCDATGFIIRNFESDFVVVAKLNRAVHKKYRTAPEFYVIPTATVRASSRRSKGWGRINFRAIPGFDAYAGRWDLIRDFLNNRKPRLSD